MAGDEEQRRKRDEDEARRARTEAEAERAAAERERELRGDEDRVVPADADEERRGVVPPQG